MMNRCVSVAALSGVLCCMVACTVASAQKDAEKVPTKQTRLDLARQLIGKTPCPGEVHNPLRVIRVVNCLRSLGKKRAISLLLDIASPDEGTRIVDPDSENGAAPVRSWLRDCPRIIYRKGHRVSHPQQICVIVPLLFDVPEKGTLPPDAWYCKQTRSWRWAAGTQVIQGGIPFAISGQWTYGGSPYPTRPLVEWAARHGELRAEPLQPEGDPLQAADALRDQIVSGVVVEFENCYWRIVGSERGAVIEHVHNDLRAQAIRMLPQQIALRLLPNGMRDLDILAWDELKQKASNIDLQWDQEKQAYISSTSR